MKRTLLIILVFITPFLFTAGYYEMTGAPTKIKSPPAYERDLTLTNNQTKATSDWILIPNQVANLSIMICFKTNSYSRGRVLLTTEKVAFVKTNDNPHCTIWSAGTCSNDTLVQIPPVTAVAVEKTTTNMGRIYIKIRAQ